MKIYKYKDLTDEKKRPHFYQIVLQRVIWCARPDYYNKLMFWLIMFVRVIDVYV